MLVTIFAIVSSFFLALFTTFTPNPQFLEILLLVSGALILLGTLLLNSFGLIPLEKLERKLIPNLMEIVRHDKLLKFGQWALYLFGFISLAAIPFLHVIENSNYFRWIYFGWMIFLGIAIDLLRNAWSHYTNLLNPSYLVKHISHRAVTAIQNDENELVKKNLDSLTEVCLNAVDKGKIALSTQTLDTFPPITHSFLSSAKSISHISNNLDETGAGSGKDEASYMIFYLLQRLELIFDRALRGRVETACRQMIMVLGKIIYYASQYDLSLVSFPTHFLTKFGLKAQQQHFDEVGVLTTSTLLEIAKGIVMDTDITYAELQPPFQAIINGLDALAKGAFKKRKDSNIKGLIQPFLDLKELFQNPRVVNHRDTPVILQEIDRVLEEYNVLEQVLTTMPTLPNFPEEQK